MQSKHSGRVSLAVTLDQTLEIDIDLGQACRLRIGMAFEAAAATPGAYRYVAGRCVAAPVPPCRPGRRSSPAPPRRSSARHFSQGRGNRPPGGSGSAHGADWRGSRPAARGRRRSGHRWNVGRLGGMVESAARRPQAAEDTCPATDCCNDPAPTVCNTLFSRPRAEGWLLLGTN